jgi:hypothetical protein
VIGDTRAGETLAAEPVDPRLPLPIIDLRGCASAELRHEHVTERSLVALQRCGGVGGPCSAASWPNGAGTDALEPLVGECRKRRPSIQGVLECVLAFDVGGEPRQNLRALAESLRPDHPARLRVPSATTERGLTAAAAAVGPRRRLFVKDGTLVYAYNFLGIPPETKVTAAAPGPGRHVVGIEFTKERMGEHHESHGPLKLYIDEQVVAESRRSGQ